jgi:hypothetical protein
MPELSLTAETFGEKVRFSTHTLTPESPVKLNEVTAELLEQQVLAFVKQLLR